MPTPPAFYAAVRGIDLHRNITITFGTEKLEGCGDAMVKRIEDMFIRFDRVQEGDEQTDGQTD